MATQRGQQLRNYINQFSEILVANRKLDVEAGINRVQEQVARGLVTPPTDEPLRDNRLYNDAWREARSENLGREAGQLLMDDTPSMIAESMEKFRFDDEEYSPSEQMTYLVNEWWEKHKANVGDTDLANHPAYQKQWESFKTRAYGALRDVVQTETVKQATGEARSIIQDRLGKLVTSVGPGDFDLSANSKSYKGIRDELSGLKYPLLKSQLEGLIHDEVISDNMNTLQDPASTQDQWLDSLKSIQALDEKGFADNGMSLSEIITGDKTPESEASTRALKQFNARMIGQDTLLKKQGDDNLEANWRRIHGLSDVEYADLSRDYISHNVPKGQVNSMLTRYDRVTKKNPTVNKALQSQGTWIFTKMKNYRSEVELYNAMELDPVLMKPENLQYFNEVLQRHRLWREDVAKTDEKRVLSKLQKRGIESFKGIDFISNQFEEKLAKAKKEYDLDQDDEDYLRAKSARLKTLKNQMVDDATFQDFTNLIDRKDLWKMPHSQFQTAIKGFSADAKGEIRQVRKEQFDQNATKEQKTEKERKEINAIRRFGDLTDPKKAQRLLDMDLGTLRGQDSLMTEEGRPYLDKLISLKRSLSQTASNAEAQAVEQRRSNKKSELTGNDSISKQLLMYVDLEGEAGVLFAEKYNMNVGDLEELRDRQKEIGKEYDQTNMDALDSDTSGKELFRILELSDKEILKVKVSRNERLSNEEHKKLVLTRQKDIKSRNETIEQNAEIERRNYLLKELTDPNQVTFLLGTSDTVLEKMLGEQSPQLAEVMGAKREAQRLMLLPENEREFEKKMFEYFEDENLVGYKIEVIQQSFAPDIPGNQERARKVLEKRDEMIQQNRAEDKQKEKDKEELAPQHLRMELEIEFADIILDTSLNKDAMISKLTAHRAKVNTRTEDLTETHHTPLQDQVRDHIEELSKEDSTYSNSWRPLVTKMFNENITYAFDKYVFVGNQSGGEDLTTRLRVKRMMAVDLRQVHRHMRDKFELEGESWTNDNVENYLDPYLEKLDKAVREKIKTLPGLEKTGEQIAPTLDMNNYSPIIQRRFSELPVDWQEANNYIFGGGDSTSTFNPSR